MNYGASFIRSQTLEASSGTKIIVDAIKSIIAYITLAAALSSIPRSKINFERENKKAWLYNAKPGSSENQSRGAKHIRLKFLSITQN